MRFSSSAAAWLAMALALPALAQEGDGTTAAAAGDTCISVSRKLFPELPKKQALARFHELNPQLGPPPHQLRAGQRLQTGKPAGPDARISFLKPQVDERRRGKPDWAPASSGDDLFRLDAVNTKRGAAAQITFKDESAMQLDEGALVVIYGGSSRPEDAEQKSGEVELVQGDVQLDLAALRGETPARQLIVRTPAAQVAARTRRARIGVDPQKMSRVSVFEGNAQVAASGARVQVPEGFGTRVEEGKAPEQPRPLPAAPKWLAPRRLVIVALGRPAADVPLRWEKVAGGVSYRVQLARDEQLNDRRFDAVVDGAAPGASAAAVAPGRYFARVFAIDAAGLSGLPSAPLPVSVVAAKAERGCGSEGLVKLALELGTEPDLEATIDGKPAPGAVELRSVGPHQLGLAARGEHDGATIACEVLAPHAELRIEPAAQEATAIVRVDPLLPAAPLSIRGLGGTTAEALTPGAVPGEYRARLASASGAYGAEVAWSGTAIATASYTPPRPPPVIAPAPLPLPLPPGDVLGPPTAFVTSPALPSAWIDARPQLRLRALGEASARDRQSGYLLSLDAQLGNDRTMGGVSLVTRHLPGLPTSAAEATLFLRLAALDQGALGVALGLDATLPGEPGAGSDSPLRFRLSGSAGLRGERLAGWTSQAIAASSMSPGWESVYAGSLRVNELISLAAQVDGLVSWGSDSPFRAAFAGGGGAIFRLLPFELGASLRAGLTPDGQRVYGRGALLLSLGYAR